MRSLVPLFALLALACESPLEPLTCDPPTAIYAIRDYPMEYGLCFDGQALSYTVESSDPAIVTAETVGDVLIVTAHEQGEASVFVTAVATDGATGTVDYRVVARNVWDGKITKCAMTPAPEEGTDFEVDAWIRSNINLVNVEVRHNIGGTEVATGKIERMSEGQTINLFTSGWMAAVPSNPECTLDLDYQIAG
ncbi:MAG: hypothetical protein OXU74_06675 [Gemmatimonadota bacterium]|nr:hypothetical protein [Gemmatimonadota bacterium]